MIPWAYSPYQDPPTGHQLRPVRVQQPSTSSLARRVLVEVQFDSMFDRPKDPGYSLTRVTVRRIILLIADDSGLSGLVPGHPSAVPTMSLAGSPVVVPKTKPIDRTNPWFLI